MDVFTRRLDGAADGLGDLGCGGAGWADVGVEGGDGGWEELGGVACGARGAGGDGALVGDRAERGQRKVWRQGGGR